MEPGDAARLLRAIVKQKMAERGIQDPRRAVGTTVEISMPLTDAASIPGDAEYDARVHGALQRLATAGYLDPEASERAARIAGYDYGVYELTESGVAWLRGLGLI